MSYNSVFFPLYFASNYEYSKYITVKRKEKSTSLHISQRSSREAGKGCGYKARAEKHPQAYCQYVEDVF